ncbi:MAG: hypothetical protein IJJ98_14415, partial [Prevotella sp.]|nr:hypothetical protein [Prevotella sp.]
MIATRYVKQIILCAITAILICSSMSCASHKANTNQPSEVFIPQAPDYNDSTMWITADGDTDGTGADIFYVVSTWEEDW